MTAFAAFSLLLVFAPQIHADSAELSQIIFLTAPAAFLPASFFTLEFHFIILLLIKLNFMGYICIALFVMFVYFGYLNFNDPDAPLWVAIYFAAAAVCMMAFFRIAYWFVDAPMIIFYVAYSIKNWPDKWMGFRMPMSHDMNIEKGRESVGLLIAAACTVFSYWAGKGGWFF